MRSRTRAGFTLIELMVAMALTLLIMAILSQAFAMALDTFTGLKGIGDMQQVLRTAIVAMQNDFAADYFEGNRRLNDPAIAAGSKPQAGFFVIRQGLPPSLTGPGYFDEGFDQNNVPSFRANDHFLYFTVKRKGNRQEDFFNAMIKANAVNAATVGNFFAKNTAYNMTPGTVAIVTLTPAVGAPRPYASQWAEVFYYLEQTGSTEEPNNPTSNIGTPIFALKRAEFAMVPDRTNLDNQFTINGEFDSFTSLSCNPDAAGKVIFNTPADAAAGQRVISNLARFVTPQPPVSVPPVTTLEQQLAGGSTLLVPNVISFQVQIMQTGATDFTDIPGNGVYDTTQFGVAGANTFGLKAIQVTLRVFDPKTRQTRQTTIIQDF